MTTSNWQKFDKAFNQVSAYTVMCSETNELIAKIALKYPKDGAGRLICYMHIIGNDVQIGTASGYGYDKKTAAIISASDNFTKCSDLWESLDNKDSQFIELLQLDKAQSGWQEVINEKNGFKVIQVI